MQGDNKSQPKNKQRGKSKFRWEYIYLAVVFPCIFWDLLKDLSVLRSNKISNKEFTFKSLNQVMKETMSFQV